MVKPTLPSHMKHITVQYSSRPHQAAPLEVAAAQSVEAHLVHHPYKLVIRRGNVPHVSRVPTCMSVRDSGADSHCTF